MVPTSFPAQNDVYMIYLLTQNPRDSPFSPPVGDQNLGHSGRDVSDYALRGASRRRLGVTC